MSEPGEREARSLLACGVLVVGGGEPRLAALPAELARAGVPCRVAPMGTTAREISSLTPALVVLELVSSERDGYATLRELRQCPESQGIAVVLVGAGATPAQLTAAFAAGAADVVGGEASLEQLAARLTAHLTRATTGAGLAPELLEADRNAVYGRLLGGLVHQLRTPLATAVFSHQDLAAGIAPGAAAMTLEPSLSLLGRSLARLTAALELLAARYDRDSQAMPGPLELNELVRGELALLAFDPRLRYQARQRLSLAEGALGGWGVARDVAQAVRNALASALAAVEQDPQPELRVTTARVGSTLELSLVAAPSVAGSAASATSAAARDAGAIVADRPWGAGIELAIARSLLVRQGGRLEATVPAAGGAAVVLSLPAREAPAGARGPADGESE